MFKGTFIFLLMLLLIFTSIYGIYKIKVFFSPKAKTITGQDSNEIKIKYSFTEPTISQSEISADYSHIEMKDAPNYAETPGYPLLPIKTAKIVIPYGKKIASVSVVLGNKIKLGNYFIEPGQKPYPILPKDDLEKLYGSMEATLPDQSIYSLNTAYPLSRFDSNYTIQTMKGYNIIFINLYPTEYYPKIRELSYYDSIVLRIKLEKNTEVDISSNYRSNNKDKQDLSIIIDNKADLNSYDNHQPFQKGKSPALETILPQLGSQPKSNPNSVYEYIIITRSDFVGDANNGFTRLIIDKQRGGTSAVMVIIDGPSGIYNNYPGRDNQEKIRNFIKDAYINWNTRYVLLGGDADGANLGGESEDPIVPVRYLKNYVWEEDIESDLIASDLYYSCLDGSYDSNNDNIFGEIKDGCDINRKSCQVDILADVYVGRAPVDSITEVNNFVRKNISYKYTASPNLNSIYFLGEYLGFGGMTEYSWPMLEEIRLGSSAYGYITKGFVENPFYFHQTMYDKEDYAWTKTELINRINNNQIHIIQHDGHANNSYVLKLSNRGNTLDVDNLTNNQYLITYSNSCYSASFDNSIATYGDPNAPTVTDTDAIGEHFVTTTAAAVAYVGYSGFSWNEPGLTDGGGQRLARQFWHGMFGQGLSRMGEFNSFSIAQNAGLYKNDYYRYSFYTIALLGDPYLVIHTSMPVAPTPICTTSSFKSTCNYNSNNWCSLNTQNCNTGLIDIPLTPVICQGNKTFINNGTYCQTWDNKKSFTGSVSGCTIDNTCPTPTPYNKTFHIIGNTQCMNGKTPTTSGRTRLMYTIWPYGPLPLSEYPLYDGAFRINPTVNHTLDATLSHWFSNLYIGMEIDECANPPTCDIKKSLKTITKPTGTIEGPAFQSKRNYVNFMKEDLPAGNINITFEAPEEWCR